MIVWIVLAVLCVIYGVLVAAVRSGNGFFIVWFVLAGIFGFLALGAWFHLWGRLPGVVRVILLVCVAAGLVFFVVVECRIAGKFKETGKPGLDYIIVLGSQVHESGPSTVLKYRLDKAVQYLEENPETVCIVSGGQGANEPFPEAHGMAEYLVAQGIPEERILLEDASLTTEENLRYSRELMNPGASIGLVTNNFHVFRALQLAEKEGLENVSGIAAESTPLYLPNNMLREFFAELKVLVS